MTFEKRRLAEADMGYAVCQLDVLGETRPIAASEAHGPAVAFDGPGLDPHVIATEPGGTMGFAPVPGRDDMLFIITGFYPVFKAEAAGIHLYRARRRTCEAMGRRADHRSTLRSPDHDRSNAAGRLSDRGYRLRWQGL